MRRRYVYIVWVVNKDKSRTLCAVFTTRAEAQRYADMPSSRKTFECEVTTEEVYTSIDDV